MLRPATLLRATVAPSRHLTPQVTPSLSIFSRRCLTTTLSSPTSTTPPAQSTPSPNPASQPQPSPSPQQPTPQTTPPPPPTTSLPYHVARTPSNNLPVYHLAKRGGNKKLTTIKKVEGDRKAFRDSIARDLGVSVKDVKINTLTGHISVVGHRKPEVTSWLQSQGF
ncbi:hypothetical protein VTK56DRAFT_3267 [Thermocarpiscus australiensis]